MSSFKRLPASVRYLIARLGHWIQPAVWTPLAVLCAGGFFIWEVSVNPEHLSIDGEDVATPNNPTSIAGLSAEDTAIASEIDSVPLLVNKFNRSNSELDLLNSSRNKGLFDEISDRASAISRPSPIPRQQAINTFVSLPNSATSAASSVNNNPQNSSLPNSSPIAILNPSRDGGLISGDKTIGEEGQNEKATLSEVSGSANSRQQNQNPLPLSPLQAAMKKYVAANTTATASSTEKTSIVAKLPDRPNGVVSPTNTGNLAPTITTAQAGTNPVNFPTALTPNPNPTNTIINDPQQVSNPATTLPESFNRLNSKLTVIPEITIPPVNVSVPKNPYQTNLSGSNFGPAPQSPLVQVATPSAIQLLPNVGKSSVPNPMVESKILNPQSSPNSADSQLRSGQPTQSNSPTQSNFSVAPQNTNQGALPIQPQPFSPQRQIPGRYLGGGEINTFSNP